MGDGRAGPVRLRCACPEAGIARSISRAAVEARLAASSNVVGPVASVYRWQDALHDATEFVMEFTTEAGAVADLCALIRRLHPYRTPAITWWPCDADPGTADWIVGAVG